MLRSCTVTTGVGLGLGNYWRFDLRSLVSLSRYAFWEAF
jgi:hypothetical protein